MKRKLLSIVASIFFGISLNAQTYDAWGLSDNGFEYDTITQYNDTLTFTFNGIPTGGWGNATLTTYFAGDFSSTSEYFTVYEMSTPSSLGDLGVNGFADCAPEASDQLTFLATDLMTWASSGTLVVKLVITSSVGYGGCDDRAKVNLQFNYCSFGTPTDYADFTVDTNAVCPHNDITMTGIPSGGVFSGTNVSGNTFDAFGLANGTYEVLYTYTDGIGCVTSSSQMVNVLSVKPDVSILVCEGGDSPALSAGNSSFFIYSEDTEHTMPIDTATNFIYGPVTQSPTVFYQSAFAPNGYFSLDSAHVTGSLVVEHDNLTGDDRGGIAVTNSYVYVVGDNNTARYDLDLQNGIVLPRRDGLFSDLQTGQLWTLYNSFTTEMPTGNNSFLSDAIMKLDDMLNPTGEFVILSQPISMTNGSDNNGILAGYGEVGLSDGTSGNVWVVSLINGIVTDLGAHYPNYYWSENWADWGILGNDGVDYFAYYRDGNTDNIAKHNLTTDNISYISNFSDVSDLSSFTVSISTNRIYFHYEGNGQFGGNDETLGYIDADFTIVDLPGGIVSGCPSEIELVFNEIDLGSDTTVCDYNTPFVLEAGFGYNSYTWNGDNNNWNIFPVSASGPVVLEVVDASNCVLIDTIEVTIDGCLGIDELGKEGFVLYPNPNNGVFTLQFDTETVNAEVSIIDMMGKTVHQETIDNNVINTIINSERLEAGLYIVNVTTNNTLYQTTFIVE